MQDFDEYPFRFSLETVSIDEVTSLAEYYRGQIYDLLKVVRFYRDGEPVDFDQFSFTSAPDELHPILGPADLPGEPA
jgi:hypothetical protein